MSPVPRQVVAVSVGECFETPMTGSRIAIRPARVEDAADILHCLREAFEPYRPQYTTGAYEDTVLSPLTIRQRLADMSVFVASHPVDGIIGTIAYALSSEGTGHIRGMAVLPHWQGQDVAAALLNQAESALRKNGCNRVTLDTSHPLHRALKFYCKHGYHPSRRVQAFFGMELIELVKRL